MLESISFLSQARIVSDIWGGRAEALLPLRRSVIRRSGFLRFNID